MTAASRRSNSSRPKTLTSCVMQAKDINAPQATGEGFAVALIFATQAEADHFYTEGLKTIAAIQGRHLTDADRARFSELASAFFPG